MDFDHKLALSAEVTRWLPEVGEGTGCSLFDGWSQRETILMFSSFLDTGESWTQLLKVCKKHTFVTKSWTENYLCHSTNKFSPRLKIVMCLVIWKLSNVIERYRIQSNAVWWRSSKSTWASCVTKFVFFSRVEIQNFDCGALAEKQVLVREFWRILQIVLKKLLVISPNNIVTT